MITDARARLIYSEDLRLQKFNKTLYLRGQFLICEIILHSEEQHNKVTRLSNRIYHLAEHMRQKISNIRYVLPRDTVNASEIKYWPTEADRPDAERKRENQPPPQSHGATEFKPGGKKVRSVGRSVEG